MKVFWGVHIGPKDSDEPLEDFDYDGFYRLQYLISGNNDWMYVDIPISREPVKTNFADGSCQRNNGTHSKYILGAQLPTENEVLKFEEFLEREYGSKLEESDHYFLGGAMQDCVARVATMLIYGEGRSFSNDRVIVEELGVHVPYLVYSQSFVPFKSAHFIAELISPSKSAWEQKYAGVGGRLEDYCDFVRLYDKEGQLHKVEPMSINDLIE